MPNPSTHYGRATPKTALRPFLGQPTVVFFSFEYPTPYGAAIPPPFRFPASTPSQNVPTQRAFGKNKPHLSQGSNW
jgi:hypothetical protein